MKTRYCECGRELEHRQRICSECREISRQHRLVIANHNYYHSEHGREVIRNYQREYHRTRYATDPAFRELHKERAKEHNRRARA